VSVFSIAIFIDKWLRPTAGLSRRRDSLAARAVEGSLGRQTPAPATLSVNIFRTSLYQIIGGFGFCR
jgi:hypothetical protein